MKRNVSLYILSSPEIRISNFLSSSNLLLLVRRLGYSPPWRCEVPISMEHYQTIHSILTWSDNSKMEMQSPNSCWIINSSRIIFWQNVYLQYEFGVLSFFLILLQWFHWDYKTTLFLITPKGIYWCSQAYQCSCYIHWPTSLACGTENGLDRG
jgi:hypothetical protein